MRRIFAEGNMEGLLSPKRPISKEGIGSQVAGRQLGARDSLGGMDFMASDEGVANEVE